VARSVLPAKIFDVRPTSRITSTISTQTPMRIISSLSVNALRRFGPAMASKTDPESVIIIAQRKK
jgi:hypothetical protein